MIVIKRDGTTQDFNFDKIGTAVQKAFKSEGYDDTPKDIKKALSKTFLKKIKGQSVNVEDIQDKIEYLLMKSSYEKVAKAYILYREKHKELRLVRDRVDYMDDYVNSDSNAASSSETDPNANVMSKNVANLDGEVYKVFNRKAQRYRMKKELTKLYDKDTAEQYERDIEHHIIYIHDEASSPSVKNYCEAVTLYPLLIDGTGNMDGLKTTAPKNLNAFCGQLVNLTFLLAAQCKGAVAFGEFFNFLDYFCAKDFDSQYHKHPSRIASMYPKRTILDAIHQAYQQIVYGWNQPAGNRSFQSPFSNISYFDSNYWHSMFDDFSFPDGSKPCWERVDFLQRDFMQWFNKERTKTLLTFPVETVALLTDGKKVLDQDYYDFVADMWSKGHSFFLYLSDKPDSLASCCRLRNQINSNVFSFTNGLTGVQTGSVNVITLNLNRIIQDCYRNDSTHKKTFNEYLLDILNRVAKYHVAYKTLIYENEKKGMLTASKANYISMEKLYSTIGINGFNEAAEYLGIVCRDYYDYKGFNQYVLGTIDRFVKNFNKFNPKFQLNVEFVPAESLGSKNYEWDKEDGYEVPAEGNHLYNSYFFKTDDPKTSVLEKLALHGRDYTDKLSGGVGCHINLEEHLTKDQYKKLIDFAIEKGTSYFTFNVPNCQCDKCGHIEKHHFDKCPECGSYEVTDWTRVIGYLRPIKSFDKARKYEAGRRIYS